MCGIAGFIHSSPRTRVTVTAMLRALAARGPDAQQAMTWDGTFRRSDDHIEHALLHTRLAIIDPRPLADQPMTNDDESVWLVYNGEVYGWRDEAQALARHGVVFRSRSDTEFILRGYEAWGIEGLLPRLSGMFAFALLDIKAGKLHLVRDRMGEKPLLYAHGADGLAFGSLVRAILPWLPQSAHALNADALDAFLAHRYIPAPMTAFRAIRRLENGHRIEYDLASRRFVKHRWYTPQAAVGGDWRVQLDAAIESRTVADRPLGIFLSGGIDSSLIACRLAATGHSELGTFSAAFPGSAMDESADAAAFAAACGLRNHAVKIDTDMAVDFSRIVADLDEPFADPSSFPTWHLARAASQHVKVVMGGDGGDELFAGYKRIAKHLRHTWRSRLPWRLPLPTMPGARGKGVSKWLTELSLDWESAYSLRFSGCTPSQRIFLQPERPPQRALWWRTPDISATSPVQRLLAWDYANYLPEYILRKADLMTLCHGLELRAPLLDHTFIEAVLALPESLRFTRPAKHLFASACPALLPLFTRPKRGFNPPLQSWLQGDLAARLPDLGKRLERLCDGQLAASRVAAMTSAYANTPALAEQILQLLMLDESLSQLSSIACAEDSSVIF